MKQYVKDMIKNNKTFMIETPSKELTEKVQAELWKNGAEWIAGEKHRIEPSARYLVIGEDSNKKVTYGYSNDAITNAKKRYKTHIPAEDIVSPDDFQVGDKVRAYGLDGVVDSIKGHSMWPIRVTFESEYLDSFLTDGRASSHHKEPSLILIERPIKKVKKSFWLWADAEGVMNDNLMDESFKTPSGKEPYFCKQDTPVTKIPGTEVTLEVEVK